MLADVRKGLPGGVHVGGSLEFLVGPAIGSERESASGDVPDDGGAIHAEPGGDVTQKVAREVCGHEPIDIGAPEATLCLTGRRV